ncbi:MAG: hypothetical protein WC551_11450 [Patescibacteria group bacterium]
MSYDFYMEADLGGPERIRLDEDEYWVNITSNVGGMYQLAFGTNDGIKFLNGKKGADALPLIDSAIAAFEATPATFEAMNPENGWGDSKGALRVLRKLKSWCESAPDAYIYISY